MLDSLKLLFLSNEYCLKTVLDFVMTSEVTSDQLDPLEALFKNASLILVLRHECSA